jgi:serine/threonine-protein kinase HipA
VNTPAGSLHLYRDTLLVGTLLDRDPLAFEYSPAWLARPDAVPVAAIALRQGAFATPEVLAYFENLLPEDEIRQYIAEQHQASTLFSLLLAVAGDTAGGFVLLRAGETPAPPHYEPTTWQALAQRLSGTSAAAIDLQHGETRISLAGAQDKAGIAIFENGQPQLPRGTAPSTHIVKPDIRRLAKVWHSAANEAIVMRAASHCGLLAAEVFYEPLTQACVVRRFDRSVDADGRMARLIQYDLCQLQSTLSARKYEKEGGPGLAACAALVRRYSTQPAADLVRLVQWVFFNLYTGNNDSHAKNLSFYWLPDGRVMLTPFHDLMDTRLYPGLSEEFAFAIGGETRPGDLTRLHLERMADELAMGGRFVLQQAEAMARRLPPAVALAVDELKPVFTDSARVLAERLQTHVASTIRQMAARFGPTFSPSARPSPPPAAKA